MYQLTTSNIDADQQIFSTDSERESTVTDGLDLLLAVLPPHIADALEQSSDGHHKDDLIELVLDLGRRPEARYQRTEEFLSEEEITRDDLSYVTERLGEFGDDNRAGIERTLHRISAIRNRTGDIVGLTCRVGRAVFGTIEIIDDLVQSGESILLLGRPGVGKTTMLREVARVLADDVRKRVVIVDTSNEIGGDGDIPHPSIGRSRRMQVPTPNMQHAVMIEAVENHMPEVIVIDEIGTELEAGAARTIAERGVQLIGTAHGNTLENLMLNPTLSDLIGGIQSVTLSDEEARRRGTQKSILERKAPPTFTIMVEIQDRDRVSVIREVSAAVDAILRGHPIAPELRERTADGVVETQTPEDVKPAPMVAARTMRELTEEAEPSESPPRVTSVNPLTRGRGTSDRPVRIFAFGVSRNRLEQAITTLAIPATIVRDLREADMVLTLKNYYRQRPRPLRDAESRGISIFVLRSNTVVQMVNLLRDLMREVRPEDVVEASARASNREARDSVTSALYETEEAINSVIDGAPPIELTPQAPYIRRLQHQLADRYNLGSRSRGHEPNRRVEIYRGEPAGS
jgi:stage III sporulation protein SpoIIIAA